MIIIIDVCVYFFKLKIEHSYKEIMSRKNIEWDNKSRN